MTPAKIDPRSFRTEQLDAVLAAMAAGEATVRLVGGCVRNILLGEDSGDVDLAVDVPPEETVRLLDEAEIPHRDHGIKFGTVMALPGEGEHFDITSLREDVETDGRWAVVSYGVDWEADARRRDFTMNAIYADPDGQLHDPLGGMPDLLARRVRFVGDAESRIREDALRILRFYRFFAIYGRGAPDSEADAACGRLHGMLANLSRQRIGLEMRKLLGAPGPQRALEAAERQGVLSEILPRSNLGCIGSLLALESELDVYPDWQRRWLAVDRGDVTMVAERMNLTRWEEKSLTTLEQAYTSNAPPLERGYRYGARLACDALLVEAAAGRAARDGLERRLKDAERGGGAICPLEAKDLLKAGWKQGPKLGKALARAEALWLEGDLAPDRSTLLAALRKEGHA